MNKLACFLVWASFSCPVLLGQGKNPIANFIRDALAERSQNMVAAAVEMPADKYGFKAPPDLITFGYLVLHVADGNYIYCSKIGGVSAPKVPTLNETDPKDKLVERLKSSFDFCTTTLAKLDDSTMGETLTIGEVKASRAMTILTLSSSWATHYSLEETYLQLNGLPSPTAKK